MKLYELTTELACQRPLRWQTHLRYSLFHPGPELTLRAGTWLLELEDKGDNVLYRLADGSVVSLAQPFSANEARPVDHPEAVRAMAAYRSPEEAALDDWGVQVEHIDRSAPFRLIKCPLCWGTEFASVDFAQVWCNTCNANFTVRHTAGDPGFVADCTWEHYSGRHEDCIEAVDGLSVLVLFKPQPAKLAVDNEKDPRILCCSPGLLHRFVSLFKASGKA